MNYQQAANHAIKAFEDCRRNKILIVKEIEFEAQFRKLTVYESSGCGNKLTSVLFRLEFCDKEGSNYREVMISVYQDEKIYTDVRLYTITSIK